MTTREERQLRRWERVANSPPHLTSWRAPRPTRVLITCYFTGLALAVFGVLGMFAWQWVLAVYLIGLLIAIVSWTMLRTTIDVKDSAPPQALDEYEADVLATWRRRSTNAFTTLLIVVGPLLIFGSLLWRDQLTALTVGTISGIAMILIALAAGSLPAVGYALTFNAREA